MEYQSYYKDNELFFHQNTDILSHDTTYGMHAHEIYEILYLVSGNGEFVVEGNRYPLAPNCIFIMRANETHHIALAPTTPYHRIVLHFLPEIIDCLDEKHTLLAPFINRPLGQQNCYIPSGISGYRIKSCLDDIIVTLEKNIAKTSIESSILTKDDYKKRLCIRSNLFIILSELNKLFQTDTKPQNIISNQRVADIINYINENLCKPLSVEIICQKFYISKSYLNSLFRQYTSSTVWKYIETKRLIYAKELIRTGTSACNASEQCGFANYSTFFRAYKKQFGESPCKKNHYH